MTEDTNAIILAAGLGTRMKSPLPKVVQTAAGLPMIEFVLRGLKGAGVRKIRAVVGHGAEHVRESVGAFGHSDVEFKVQRQQLGTADAVKAAEPQSLSGTVVICNGDHPLIKPKDFQTLLKEYHSRGLDLAVVSTVVKDPAAFGRIVRDGRGRLQSIVETKEASSQQLKIQEVNTGIYIARAELLNELVGLVRNDNKKGEYYLTDIIAHALKRKLKVDALRGPLRVSMGVNNQEELAHAERILRKRKIKSLFEAGVKIIDPAATYIDSDVEVGEGSVIHPGVQITGKTRIGCGCVIEAHVQIKDSEIGDDVQVKWGSIIESSRVGRSCMIGPYGRLRPESNLGEECHIGNFVELKKVNFGNRSKANHLTYLGDADVGEDTNIGCGTITCNYAVDKKKYRTKIGSRAFIGSDSQFVAPVTIGDDAVIASGSTITEDVPDGDLAIARGRQVNKPGVGARLLKGSK